ncbi:HET domain-containing protein [Fusarium falciforme]|uniref:HET domain-containing protein n=1 Tax=Fusarium falciforme TaxID=195108 RepID=UPI002301A421|nr:HET domain-containing protein [Fusarium falciforme]WAO87832.1 HET domain-containing protein [Fusarium falciforme]
MHLLNTTSLKLEYFVGHEIPKHAILSHRWEAEEILFEDVQTDRWPQKKGIDKVKRACLRAKDDGFEYIWIDTCCIDKSSSAELSEAINSMFKWYHGSQVCYAYLCDVSIDETETFAKSEWFTRGWTLQELIAPQQVHFFDSQWKKIGDRLSLLDSIVKVTGIDRRVLGRGQHHRCCEGYENRRYKGFCRCVMNTSSGAFRQLLSSFSVATRMSWASRRVTKRVEDQAYALLGLFNVNMPLLYGEGTKAFRRLQEEIIRTSNDQSILASDFSLCFFLGATIRGGGLDVMDDAFGHLFPSQPRAFMSAADLERPSAFSKYLSMTLTNHRLNIDLQMCPCSWQDERIRWLKTGWLGILDCVYSDDYLPRPAILLDRLSSAEDDQDVFIRILMYHNASVRISPVALLDANKDVGISKRGLKVWFNPSHIKMMNIDLLLQAPTQAQGMRTPAIRINPVIGGHDDMTYRIRTSFPELEETPKGHIRDVTFSNTQEIGANRSGILAIHDGSRHGFFVAYGFLEHTITNPEARDSPEFGPWCRLLKWRRVVPDGEFIPKDDESANALKDIVQFNNSSRNNLPESGDDVHPHDSMDWPGRPGLRAQVAMTPNTFLGQTVYKLDISVWRIDGSSETQGSGHGGRGSHKRSSRRR